MGNQLDFLNLHLASQLWLPASHPASKLLLPMP